MDLHPAHGQRVLLVDDQALLAREITRALRPLASVEHADSLAAANGLLRGASHDRWAAAIIDVCLPDGVGTALLTPLRALAPAVPVLVMTGHLDGRGANDALQASAFFAVKPLSLEVLRGFVERALQVNPSARIRSALERCATHYLSPRETEILELALSLPRDEVPSRAHVSANTLKTHIRHILQKTSEPSLDALARRVLRDAL